MIMILIHYTVSHSSTSFQYIFFSVVLNAPDIAMANVMCVYCIIFKH